ncbi:MAG TPA: hypothetical protein DF613_11475 [Lachnospiraceae bacterium]|nr:hypothetical protein [Lachnospiraceae bacterium]
MHYTNTDLVLFFLIYSFLGWVTEVLVVSLRQKHFCNRGFYNLPVCPSYGVILDILLLALPTLQGHFFIQYLTTLVVLAAVHYYSGATVRMTWGRSMWRYERNNMFGGGKLGFFYSCILAAAALLTFYLVHPMLFVMVKLIPMAVRNVIAVTGMVLLAADHLSILYAVVHNRKNKNGLLRYRRENQKSKGAFGSRLYAIIWHRLDMAYPEMEIDRAEPGDLTFAKGICFDKMVWVFVICALGGDMIETVFCRFSAGHWMSRSSVIYGPFSIVWGFGAVLLTIVLDSVALKDDRYVFGFGCLLGGVYEYTCSVFTEFFLGTTFWDYSDMPFNIGGRTNLLFCSFWGILSVVWVKICYPRLSAFIEKFPPLGGKIATWVLIAAIVCDGLISATAMVRYTQRAEGQAPAGSIGEFVDTHYPDWMIEKIWPNMRIDNVRIGER